MVRTRELRRALGRVIGQGLGTQVSGDVDEAPQRLRSIAFASRQRAIAPIAKDVEHVECGSCS